MIFNRNQGFNRVQKKQLRQKEDVDCEIKVKYNKHGRMSGMTTRGNCTKEDKLAFAKQNGISLNENE